MKKWYQKSIAIFMAAACLFAGGTIGLARDSLPQLQLTAEAEDKLYTGESDGLQLNYEELEDGTIEITKFVDSTSTDIELPAVIDGKSVTSIGERAFYGCENLTSITISDSVTNIEHGAFFYCNSLKNVKISKNVIDIGDSAFANCQNLANIIIPESTINIGSLAFAGCADLTSVSIPKNTTSIGDNSFISCDNLEEFIVDSDNPSYSSEDGVLFDKNMETLLQCPVGKSGIYTIPTSVINIKSFAFSNCNQLENIITSENIKNIG